MRVSLIALRKTGTETYDRTLVRMHLFVGPMCSPKSANGLRTYNPDVATHKKPKKPVIIVELP